MGGDINPHKLRKLCMAFHHSGLVIIFGGKSSNEANIVDKTSLVSPVG